MIKFIKEIYDDILFCCVTIKHAKILQVEISVLISIFVIYLISFPDSFGMEFIIAAAFILIPNIIPLVTLHSKIFDENQLTIVKTILLNWVVASIVCFTLFLSYHLYVDRLCQGFECFGYMGLVAYSVVCTFLFLFATLIWRHLHK